MADEPDYILDVDGLKDMDGEPAQPLPKNERRRWLGVHFECCGVYARVYRNRSGTAYVGNCPRCCRSVRIRIGSGGTSCRFFRAT